MRNLQELYLGRTKITGAGPKYLAQNTNLTKLAFYDTHVGNAAAPAIAAFSKLQWLSLANTRITDEALADLELLEHLAELRLTGCTLSADALNHLRFALPDTKIVV